MYYTQDADNVRRNMVTIVGDRPAYNAIIEIISKAKQNGATDPVTTADVKTFSHIDENDDDAKIAMLIPAACDMIENYSGVGLRKLDVVARINNSAGNIRLLFGQYGDVTNESNEVVDLKVASPDDFVVKYTAGNDVINSDLKVVLLMQIDFMLRGGVGMDAEVKKLLQNYMQ
ncbi:MAG: phage gp6-like head-tail connector protein [Chitinophagales bacterium]|nr:phage gp6-like head-tail connector protein [Chitinophagales bacterium]